jgi:TRAP-type mannitol/chloroaromatic compound transport system permease small subunit
LTKRLAKRMLSDMRQHLVSHWRVWLLIVVVVVVVNEVVDRNFFDHREHVDGDFALALVTPVIGFIGSYLVGRRKTPGTA